MTLIILPGNALCVLLLSVYLTTASFTYLLQHYKGKRNKENFFVFICSLLTFALSIFYFVFEFLYGGKQHSIKSKFLCALTPIVYKTCVSVSKVFSSLIFVYRYELIKQRRLLGAPKKTKIYSAMIILFSILQFTGHVIYVTAFRGTSERNQCRYGELFTNENVFYGYVSGGMFLLKTVLQTVILVGIIRPIYKHYLKSTTAYSSNSKTRNTLYRVVWCAIMLLAGDICLVVAFFSSVQKGLLPATTLFVTYLFVDVFTLLFSYKDCGKRLFPFKTIFKNKLNEDSNQSGNTRPKENATRSQVNSTLEVPSLKLDRSKVSCTLEYSVQTLDERQVNK